MKNILSLLVFFAAAALSAANLTPADVTAKVAAVAPIDGISFGSLSDKSTWTVQYQATATDAEKAAAQVVIDNITTLPLVAQHKAISMAVFYDRLTASERTALKSSTDASVAAWVEKMSYCSSVDLDTAESETMQAYLVSLGLFTSERIAEIFK